MKKSTVILCSFLIFYVFFFKATSLGLSPTISGWLTNGCFLLLGLILLQDGNHFLDRQYRVLNISILAFAILSIISVYSNIDYIGRLNVLESEGFYMTGVQTIRQTVYKSLGLVFVAFFIERLVAKNQEKIFLESLFICIGLWLIVVDIDAFNHKVIDDDIEGYLIGNKFNVCYLNLYLCIIYYMLHPDLKGLSKVKLGLLLTLLMLISIHTQCSTTVMGCAVFIFLAYFVKGKFRLVLSKPNTMLITLIICDIAFFFFSTWFLQFPIVQDLIVNVLNEDLTLTGRLLIYQNIQDAFSDSPWIGYGVGNSSIISRMYTGAYDSQNGLVDLFIQVGVLGCILYFLIIYLLMNKVGNKYNKVYPIIVMIYTFLIISMVEIPFGNLTLLFCFFLLVANSKEANNCKNTVTYIE